MLNRLNCLYREASKLTGLSPWQSQALADAAFVLGSRGLPGSFIREAVLRLEAAFENRVAAAK